MSVVVNPFAGHAIGFTWAQHKSAGLEGGTDYEVAGGVAVTAATAGTASTYSDGLNTVQIVNPDGLTVSVRELRSRVGVFPRHVNVGDVIGITGRVGMGLNGKLVVKWPHIDAIDPHTHVRVPFEPFINQTSTASTGSTPLEPDAASTVPTVADIARLIQKAGPDMKCMLIGDISTGAVCFGPIGGEGRIFESAADYEGFAAAWNFYGSWAKTPDDWKLPPVPATASHDTILFVTHDQWISTVKAVFIG